MTPPPPLKKTRVRIRYGSFHQGASVAILGHGEYSELSDIAFTEITGDATRRMKFLLLWTYASDIILYHLLYFFCGFIFIFLYVCHVFFPFGLLIFNSSSLNICVV